MKKKVLGIILAGCMCAGLTLTVGVGVENVQAADKKLIYISRDMTDPFGAWLANSMQEKGEAAGYKVTVMDEQNDAAKCVEMLENAKNSSPDAIVLQPTSDAQVLNTINSIRDEGIPVVVVNLTLPEDPEGAPTVLCDDVTLGKTIGAVAAENLPENANIVILNGIPGFSVSLDRREGFQEGLLDARDDITVLDELDASFNKDEAMNAMDDWLQKYDNIDGVICQSDGMALGAIESYKSNNKDISDVQFYGIDGLADGCLSIEAGELTATVLQDANAMADKAIEMVNGLLDGSIEGNPIESIDAEVITKDNVEDMIASHKENGLID